MPLIDKIHPLLESLSYGDKRSIMGVKKAMMSLENNPSLFSILVKGMSHNNELIAMRSSDAVEKLSVIHPDWLIDFKKSFIKLLSQTNQQEVLWHLAQLVPRLILNKEEKHHLIQSFENLCEQKSRIVVSFSLQAMVDLAEKDSQLIRKIYPIIKNLRQTGTSAVRSRGRKLLKQLDLTEK